MKALRVLALPALSLLLLAGPVLAQELKPDSYRDRTTPPAATPRPEPPTAPPPRQAAPPAAPGASQSQPQGELIDINSATKQQLQTLKGVGPARADEIIKKRPYKAKNELVERKILPPNVYEENKDRIVARQSSAASGTGGGTATKKQ